MTSFVCVIECSAKITSHVVISEVTPVDALLVCLFTILVLFSVVLCGIVMPSCVFKQIVLSGSRPIVERMRYRNRDNSFEY